MKPDLSTLVEWIQRHRVTWEVGPLQEVIDHVSTSVGFELRLFGRHAPDTHPSPGCPDCQELHARLRAIAEAALPTEARPTIHEIEPFDASFHLRPESEWAPEVQLIVRSVHRQGYLSPVDGCERRCLKETQDALRALGAQPRSWVDPGGQLADPRS